MRWYWTGTSMAVTRSRWAISRNFTTSDRGIRMVVPPMPIVASTATSVVLGSGVEASETVVGAIIESRTGPPEGRA